MWTINWWVSGVPTSEFWKGKNYCIQLQGLSVYFLSASLLFSVTESLKCRFRCKFFTSRYILPAGRLRWWHFKFVLGKMFKHVNGETVGENHVLVIFYGFLVKVLVFHFNVSLLGHMRHDPWSLRWCPLASAHWCVRRSWRLFSFCWSSLCAPDFNHKQYQDERSIYLSFPIHIFFYQSNSINTSPSMWRCALHADISRSDAFGIPSGEHLGLAHRETNLSHLLNVVGVVRLDRIPSTHKRPEVVRTLWFWDLRCVWKVQTMNMMPSQFDKRVGEICQNRLVAPSCIHLLFSQDLPGASKQVCFEISTMFPPCFHHVLPWSTRCTWSLVGWQRPQPCFSLRLGRSSGDHRDRDLERIEIGGFKDVLRM